MVFNGLLGIFNYTFSFEPFLIAVFSKLNLKQTESIVSNLAVKTIGIVPEGLFPETPASFQRAEARSLSRYIHLLLRLQSFSVTTLSATDENGLHCINHMV